MGAFGWSSEGGGRAFASGGSPTGDPFLDDFNARASGRTNVQAPPTPAPTAGWDPTTAMLTQLGGALIQYQGQREANRTNRDIANDANTINVQEAETNRQFQENMSNTAFQRQMQDLAKSGLNPLLAAGMNGASTPSGATGSGVTTQVENALQGIAGSAKDIVQTQLAFQKQGADIALSRDQQELTKAQTSKTKVDAAVATKGIPEADIKNRAYKAINKLFDRATPQSQNELRTSTSAQDAARRMHQQIKQQLNPQTPTKTPFSGGKL